MEASDSFLHKDNEPFADIDILSAFLPQGCLACLGPGEERGRPVRFLEGPSELE